MAKREINYILVLGYGWSGSSAVVDYLREFDDLFEPEKEFRLIKDPRGLIDLRHELIDRYDVLNSDIAIREFKWFASMCYQCHSKFKNGLDYADVFGDKYIEYTDEFVNSLSTFKYNSTWWYLQWRFSFPKLLLYKMKTKLKQSDTMYFINCSGEYFDQKVKEYINNLFSIATSNKNISSVILDQAIPVSLTSEAKHYFDSYKIIVVDRDPRDIYVDLIKGRNLIGQELALSHDVSKYIKWHNSLRTYKEKFDENVIQISFEDFVLNHDETSRKICDFLKIEIDNQAQKGKYFKMDQSTKNIGLYHKYQFQNEIDKIAQALPNYLHKI